MPKRKPTKAALLKADAKRAGDHPTDYVNEYLDAALTEAEEHLSGLLKYFTPDEIAEQFEQSVTTHLRAELSNIEAHGHRMDDPDDTPEDQHPQTDSHLAGCPSCMMAHDKALPDGEESDEVQS